MSTGVDLLEIYSAGARLKQEESRALPQHHYGDPARHVKFEREKCTNCKYERIIQAGQNIGVGICMKNNQDGSKRLYGTRCADFREKGTK